MHKIHPCNVIQCWNSLHPLTSKDVPYQVWPIRNKTWWKHWKDIAWWALQPNPTLPNPPNANMTKHTMQEPLVHHENTYNKMVERFLFIYCNATAIPEVGNMQQPCSVPWLMQDCKPSNGFTRPTKFMVAMIQKSSYLLVRHDSSIETSFKRGEQICKWSINLHSFLAVPEFKVSSKSQLPKEKFK